MTGARTLAAAALIVLLAGSAHAQTGPTEGETETELAPQQAVAPDERPAETPLAPAEGAPAPEPRPDEAGPASGGELDEADPEAGGAEGRPAPETAPVPPSDPEAPAGDEAPSSPEAAPVPAEDKAGGAEAPVAVPVPAEAPVAAPVPAEPPVPEQLAEDDAALAACLGRLRALGTAFERVDQVSDEGGACGIANPLSVTEIVPGVALEPAGVMRCAAAAALTEWVSTFVLPASRVLPERGALTAVEHASAYVCRRIGDGEEGEWSEHAFGNAVDVMAFRFADGPAIPVEPREREGTAAEAFQRTARASACLLFTTVIGPGQEGHDDHLHLDIEPRDSGYRLCQ